MVSRPELDSDPPFGSGRESGRDMRCPKVLGSLSLGAIPSHMPNPGLGPETRVKQKSSAYSPN